MIKLVFGVKGTGKTKIMLDTANQMITSGKGDIVYIDRNQEHMHGLDKRIRLINTGDFNLVDFKSFYGFLCGIISQNFDVEAIFIDGQKLVSEADSESFDSFITDLQKLEKQFNVSFIVSCSRAITTVSEYAKKLAV